jgi:hypothetical protein
MVFISLFTVVTVWSLYYGLQEFDMSGSSKQRSLRELTFFCVLLPIVSLYYAKLTLQDYVRAMCNKKWIDEVESLPRGAIQATFAGDYSFSQYATKSAKEHMQDKVCMGVHMRSLTFPFGPQHFTCGGICCSNQ